METFETMITKKGKKYYRRFYPLLLENNQFLKNKYKSILNSISLKKNVRILDLGCGTGIYLSLLKSFSQTVYGVDKSYILVKEARDVLGERQGIKIFVSEAEKLPFQKEIFDLVFLNDAFIHFENQEEAIIQIKSVLKKNGSLVLIEPNIINPAMMLTLLFFKDGWRIFHSNKAIIRKKLSRYFIIERELPFNLMYMHSKVEKALFSLLDIMTSFRYLSFLSLRYVIIARKIEDR